jgi:hypothetical protein
VGNVGRGLWRYALGGARYLPAEWPDGDVGLDNRRESVAILEALPEADKPPDYPSPAASPSSSGDG